MEENNTYELIGVINEYNSFPSVKAYPVFMGQDGKFYKAIGDEYSPYISSFKEIEPDSKKRIKRFTKTSNIFEIEVGKLTYEVGDKNIAALELRKGELYVGTLENWIEFAKSLQWCINAKISSFPKSNRQMINEFLNDLQNRIDVYTFNVAQLGSK